MVITEVLVRPLVTEKTTSQEDTYCFEIGVRANKLEVRKAIESFYGVDVADVRTSVVRGKLKRFGRHYGKRKNWKKAWVTLKPGQSISLFEG
jgi:large subunit ribosomal protein L23